MQVVKLLEDALRGQAPSQPSQPAFPQHSLPAEHPGPSLMGLGMHPLSYPSFARYLSFYSILKGREPMHVHTLLTLKLNCAVSSDREMSI